jgi:hypothetical protein
MTSRYQETANRADRISKAILDRARKACREAGLDPALLGIHPHNAMCSFQDGKPWPGVDYQKVRLCIHLINKSYEPSRILDAWTKRIYAKMGNIEGHNFIHRDR